MYCCIGIKRDTTTLCACSHAPTMYFNVYFLSASRASRFINVEVEWDPSVPKCFLPLLKITEHCSADIPLKGRRMCPAFGVIYSD
jgi:hypothetical protein